MSPEKCIVVVIGIILILWEKADGVNWPEGSSPAYAKASMRDTSSRRFQLWPATAGVWDQGMYPWG